MRVEATTTDSVQPRNKGSGAKSRPTRSGKEAEAKAKVQMVEISPALLLAAVESLYADELKPVGRILRKRITEMWPTFRSKRAEGTIPDVGAEQLRTLCRANPLLTVEPEEGGDFSALLVGRQQSFVDIYNTQDSYSSEMWFGLRAYCESPRGQEMSLPGGRYACAQAFAAFDLPCLAGYSLGRMCHIVQLAITQKKILGYMNGDVVAYSKSQSKVKEQLASEGHPVTVAGQGEEVLHVASLREAQSCMRDILRDASGKIPLSNVKRFFRSKFEFELSETSLGHSKLSELLNSHEFKGICAVELQENGYVVVETAPEPSGKPHHDFASIAPLVQRTFIQYNVPRSPELGSRRRSCSVPKDMEFGQSWCEVMECVEKFGGRDSRQSTAASSGCAGDATPPSSSSDLDQNDSEEDQEYDAPSGKLMMPSMSSWVDEPLQFEDEEDEEEVEDHVHADDMSITPRRWHPLTPGMLAREGYQVQNTFFHVAPQLPTPVRTGAMHRSKSLPRGFGGTNSDCLSASDRRPISYASPSMQSPPLASPSVYWPSTPAMNDRRRTSYTSPSMQSPPLASPSVYWPSTPAEPDVSQNLFSWAPVQCGVFQPPALALPAFQLLHPPAPVAPRQNILCLAQHI